MELQEQLKRIEARLTELENKSSMNKALKELDKIQFQNTVKPTEIEEGYIAYVGNYKSEDGTMGSLFGNDKCSAKELLSYNSFEMAQVVDAFSNEDRINIVKELIQNRQTAKQLIDTLHFQTTGKLYHHLSFLEKIGVVKKENEQYFISSKFIGCILLIFGGVAKIIRNNEK